MYHGLRRRLALFLVAPMLALASAAAAPCPRTQAEPPTESWPWAATLSSPITLGISAEDRSLVDAELRRLAETVGRRAQLPLELASEEGYSPSTRALERTSSALVAFDRWDRDSGQEALEAGVDVMFVVTSASARNGKKVRKKYVPTDKTKGDQKPRNVDVHSLLFKYRVEVLARESPRKPASAGPAEGGAVEDPGKWVRVSQIRRDGERDNAPMFLGADTKKVTWDLANVVAGEIYGDLKTARIKLASAWPDALDASTLERLYGTLDEAQKARFWQRARLASPVKIGLPVDQLLELALEEWARARKGQSLSLLRGASRGYVQDWVRGARSGWRFDSKPAWFLELTVQPERRRAGPEPAIGVVPTKADELENASIEVEELLEGFRTQRPISAIGRRLPSLAVVAPEEIDLTPFAQAAPDPARFYRAAGIYTEDDYAKVKRSKSNWLKSYGGLKVLRARKIVLKQSARSLDPGPVIERLFPPRARRWPGDED